MSAINIIYCVVLLGYCSLANATFEPPRIITEEDEFVIPSNSNFTLRCEGKREIKWTPPNNTYQDTENPIYSSITIQSSHTPDREYTHGSILTIYNASYLDTGFYYCHENTYDFEDLSRVSRVYVYVSDDNQLSVVDQLSTAITVSQNSEAILPCRPTSPNVTVELTQATGEELQTQNVSYDPKVGFRLYTNDLSGHTLYTCEFSKIVDNSEKYFDLDVLLYVETIIDSLAKPYLQELSDGHAVVGQKLELKCTLSVIGNLQFAMEWIVPDKMGLKSGRVNVSKSIKKAEESQDQFHQILTIDEARPEDQGEYICLVKAYKHENNNTKYVKVYDKHENFINLTEENGVYNISVRAGEPSVQWSIDVKAHPIPIIIMKDSKNKTITNEWSDNVSKKYEIETSPKHAFLKINNITIFDRGTYRIIAKNKIEETLMLFLNVTDKPIVKIKIDSFHEIGTESEIQCHADAYPEPVIRWYYKPCLDDTCQFEPKNHSKTEFKGFHKISYLNLNEVHSGYVLCNATNSLGSDEAVQGYFVTDVKNGFGIWGVDDETKEIENGKYQYPIALGDTIKIYCAASHFNYTNEILWFKKNNNHLLPLEDTDRYAIEKSTTEYSNKVSLTIENVHYNDSGIYLCQAEMKDKWNGMLNDTVVIAVRDSEEPTIIKTNLNNSNIIMTAPDKLELWCYARGIPKPTIYWYKDGKEIFEISSKSRKSLMDNHHKLVFNSTQFDDEGSYTCKAVNKAGDVQRQIYLKFDNKIGFNYQYITWIVVLTVIFVIIVVILVFRWQKEKKLRRELKLAGLANFENGALESFNPELGIDDQAELLPYDKNYEFPREKLKLGKQLGSGAFGVVLKAIATGISEEEEKSTVAVKMVKRTAENTYIKALASELKIMVHLGKHLNVVNLLGACTKNVAKRELLVIVEYCRYGNLHNYLLRHRNNFIDQIDPKTGKIDYTFGSELMERSFSVSSNSSSKTHSPLPNSMADYRDAFNYTGNSVNTESTTVSMIPTGESGPVVSNNSVQPEWRSNYTGDYKGSIKPICTKDLISWAFQVARGMDYLASRKVLHGDLAARNILLAENGIVKICDFGLAKSMYKSDNYKKQGDGPLPVKWMAVESIRDRVFSTQSDVWSYGIVLWEFFSLAHTPYTGMEADERLYNKLIDGYRMEPPQYATKELYQIMSECWYPKPVARPSFVSLAETIGLMLEESVRQHYIDLNDPYLIMNTQRLENGQSDYLAMLSPPDFEHLSSPHNYVNEEVRVNLEENSGYLCMKPTNIFSPRETPNDVFNFDGVEGTSNKKPKNSEVALGTELLPMLYTKDESQCNSPSTPISYSNPTYQVPPKIVEKTEVDIVKSVDNYVNMPQNKTAVKLEQNCANNNLNGSTNNYVNSTSRDWEKVKN